MNNFEGKSSEDYQNQVIKCLSSYYECIDGRIDERTVSAIGQEVILLGFILIGKVRGFQVRNRKGYLFLSFERLEFIIMNSRNVICYEVNIIEIN